MTTYRNSAFLSKQSTVLFALLLLILLAGLALFAKPLGLSDSLALFGRYDYRALWAGVQLFLSGENPYDFLAVQTLAGIDPASRHGFVTPPWALFLLAPAFSWPLSVGSWLWVALNMVMAVASAHFVAKTFARDTSQEGAYLWGTLLCFPLVDAIELGQLAVFLTFVLSVFIWAARRGGDLLQALLVLVFTTKPHLFSCVFLLWAYRSFQRRLTSQFAVVVVAFGLMFALPVVLRPSIYNDWTVTMSHYNFWQTPTLSDFLRGVFVSGKGAPPTWPMVVVPCLGMALFMCVILVMKVKANCPLYLLAAAASLGFAPYAWLYDFVLLAPAQGWLVGRAWHYKNSLGPKIGVLGAVALIQLSSVLLVREDTFDHYFIWYPWAILLLVSIGMRYFGDEPWGEESSSP